MKVYLNSFFNFQYYDHVIGQLYTLLNLLFVHVE